MGDRDRVPLEVSTVSLFEITGRVLPEGELRRHVDVEVALTLVRPTMALWPHWLQLGGATSFSL